VWTREKGFQHINPLNNLEDEFLKLQKGNVYEPQEEGVYTIIVRYDREHFVK